MIDNIFLMGGNIMFINKTDDALKLYELQVKPELKQVMDKIASECPYDSYEKRCAVLDCVSDFGEKTSFSFGYLNGDIINGDLLSYDSISFTNEFVVPRGPSLYSRDNIYIYKYRLIHLVPLYFTLMGLENKEYQSLANLNSFCQREFDGLNQELFNKYESEIFDNIKLTEVYSGDCADANKIFNGLYEHASLDYRKKLDEVEKLLEVHSLNISSLPCEVGKLEDSVSCRCRK